MSDERKCEKRVWSDGHSYACRNSAKLERNGKWYCHMHDPVAVQEKREARVNKWKDGWEAQQKSWDAQKRRAEAGELGIELAKYIVETSEVSCELRILRGQILSKAQAVIAKLEKAEEPCQRKKS